MMNRLCYFQISFWFTEKLGSTDYSHLALLTIINSFLFLTSYKGDTFVTTDEQTLLHSP